MNFEDLKTEFLARGFDYLSSTRAGLYLNDSYLLDVCEEEDWPFLEASKSGTAPLEISDLRAIEYVIDETSQEKLTPLIQGRITDDVDVDLTTPGTPEFYYVTEGKKVRTYPVSTTDEVAVTYWKFPTELSGTDEPLLPTRFHSLIVDGAVARAYEDSDDQELATAAEAKFNGRLERMRTSLMNLQHDAPDDHIVLTDPARLR